MMFSVIEKKDSNICRYLMIFIHLLLSAKDVKSFKICKCVSHKLLSAANGIHEWISNLCLPSNKTVCMLLPKYQTLRFQWNVSLKILSECKYFCNILDSTFFSLMSIHWQKMQLQCSFLYFVSTLFTGCYNIYSLKTKNGVLFKTYGISMNFDI